MKILILFVLSALLACNSSDSKSDRSTTQSEKIRIILDTDANNELDDQHAIAYMLFNSQIFDVAGITVNKTRNGGSIDDHFAEAVRIVKLCNRYPEIKVYKGASGIYSDIVKTIDQPDFDGSDAVNFIIDKADAQVDGKLVLLPIGKLTNIALALKKKPSIASKLRIVWLGTNYPKPGEYNFVNDTTALDPILASNVEFEMVMVRYGEPTGTDAVKAYLKDFQEKMPDKGPHIAESITGRHGGEFNCFGDYSVNLFENFRGHPSARPLFDMAAVSIVKNPNWADRVEISAPKYAGGKWIDLPENKRKIIIWESFKSKEIMDDFYKTIENAE